MDLCFHRNIRGTFSKHFEALDRRRRAAAARCEGGPAVLRVPSQLRSAPFLAGVVAAALAMTVLLPAPASAHDPAPLAPPTGTLTEVTDFGPNPTNLQMHLYVPPTLAPHPAIVVVLHYCTGTGPAMFNGTQFAS